MNTIVDRKAKKDRPLFSGTVDELLDKQYLGISTGFTETAFIGKAGTKEGVFLIVFECVVLAERPNTTYSGGASVVVEKYVDIEITIKEKA